MFPKRFVNGIYGKGVQGDFDNICIAFASGGMLVQKLNPNDLQFENLKPFDGTMAYAQNKRQQIVMTEQYAQVNMNYIFNYLRRT